ncbi:hypothetical protein [Pontibacter brevis]
MPLKRQDAFFMPRLQGQIATPAEKAQFDASGTVEISLYLRMEYQNR